MSATVSIEELRVGMFIHLDLGWWAHPFALSSFLVSSVEQIATIRSLGVKRLRWSPERSQLAAEPAPPVVGGVDSAPPDDDGSAATDAVPETDAGKEQSDPAARAEEARARRCRHLAAQRNAAQLCQRQYTEAAKAWQAITDSIGPKPVLAGETAEALTRALLDKMMVEQDMCIRVLSEGAGDRSTLHALNVAVISLLMGRTFGFGPTEMADLGVGAMLHDIGKIDLPARVRQHDASFTTSELALYRTHVAQGLAQANRMGLAEGAAAVIAQHHEMVDASGFPARLAADRIGAGARIVALVNRYDNLCNPLLPHLALTPHEALSLLFAQSRSKFDASMLNAFIRMMGVYPPGSVVQLSDDRYALVIAVNSSRPLKPRVLVHDPDIAAEEALLLDLESQPELGIRRSVRPSAISPEAQAFLSPRQRIVYFFEQHVAAELAPEAAT